MLVAAREAGVGVTQEAERLTRHLWAGVPRGVRGSSVEVNERREGSTGDAGSELDGVRFELGGGGAALWVDVHGPLQS